VPHRTTTLAVFLITASLGVSHRWSST